ncbi:hypothetical protein AGDE_09275 [Angomonas deanei]|uniref:Uncharacterized protein n=1 Tax=Angomonas deanei TaxID=59799 RepID=A0A7G2CED7_9TRYP|nr:hypothetical protein AGDE_09275 [Angomonas deanei]CAD2218220.1 hypothetical protein, conserved [Angomonas deanei]|eukprot:EPY30769.1 hypothetical protein AGDE_09275 [Angomonas deanei]
MTDNALDQQVQQCLQSINTLLHQTRRESGVAPTTEASQMARLYGVPLERDSSRVQLADGEEGGSSNPLWVQLATARDLLRRLDSERRHLSAAVDKRGKDAESAEGESEQLRQRATESHKKILQLQTQLTAAKADTKSTESLLDHQTKELLTLKRFVRSLPPPLVNGYLAVESGEESMQGVRDVLGLVPDRKFEEAFKDKMDVLLYKRRYERAKKCYERFSQQVEASCMEAEDQQTLLGETTTDDEAPISRGRVFSSPSTGATLAAVSLTASSFARAPTVMDFPMQLPFSPVTPQEARVKALIYKSKFAEPLMEVKENTQRHASRLKTVQDCGLYRLRTQVMDILKRLPVSERAYLQTSFDKNMDALMRTHREILFSLIQLPITLVTQVTDKEKVNQRDATSDKKTRSVGCMAVDTSAEDYRLHRLQEELHQYKLKSLEQQTSLQQKADALSDRYASELQVVQALFSNLRDLTAAITTTAARCQGEKVVDPLMAAGLPSVGEVDPDDQRLTAKLGEATQLDIIYVKSLAAAFHAENTKKEEEEKVPKAATRKDAPRGSLPSLQTSKRSSVSGGPPPRSNSKTGGKRKKSHTPLPLASGPNRRHTIPNAPVEKPKEPTAPTGTKGASSRRLTSSSLDLGKLSEDLLLPEAAQTTRDFSNRILTEINNNNDNSRKGSAHSSKNTTPNHRGTKGGTRQPSPANDNSPSNVTLNVVQLDFDGN